MPSEFRGEANLLGIQIALRSNSREALHTALSIFAKWNCGGEPTQTICVALCARNADLTMSDRARIVGPHLSVVQDGIALRANGRWGVGGCVFAARDVSGEAFREAIHTVVLFLVAHAGRTPVHASAVVIGDTAIVLAGSSRSGKSSLALAADRAGLPVLSEDSVFVQLEPSFRVWGMAESIHMLATGAPAVDNAGNLRVRKGRVKRVLPIAHPRRTSTKACLCVITRGDAVGL